MDKTVIRETSSGYHVVGTGMFPSLHEAIKAVNGDYCFIPFYKESSKYYGS